MSREICIIFELFYDDDVSDCKRWLLLSILWADPIISVEFSTSL